ncbi:uncharacterized protein N0V89_010515 [Didymosphaeria variabile]|uniref:Uncharacterized protein n=1 Tax=Didymosphaeria variabile TaxID=1932322 RepID=A0A9W8XBF2_9PLEO|nr:uncharacterized protein N0V89_010515 [Didymosphaeria variabile]KAJ4346584.1 hypothetical protein N0V89_010515 [Didymosphaeria variabile]
MDSPPPITTSPSPSEAATTGEDVVVALALTSAPLASGDEGGTLFLLVALATSAPQKSVLSPFFPLQFSALRMPSVVDGGGGGGGGWNVSIAGSVTSTGVCTPKRLPQRHSEG